MEFILFSSNVTEVMNKFMEKNHMYVSIEVMKLFDTISPLFLILKGKPLVIEKKD